MSVNQRSSSCAAGGSAGELAMIFARGVLQLRQSRRRAGVCDSRERPSATCLEVSGEIPLSVPSGLRPRESRGTDDEPEGGHE